MGRVFSKLAINFKTKDLFMIMEPNKYEIDQDILECTICYEEPTNPMFQCCNGHLLCKVCHPKLKECPTCRIKLQKEKPIRNLTAEIFHDISIGHKRKLNSVVVQKEPNGKEEMAAFDKLITTENQEEFYSDDKRKVDDSYKKHCFLQLKRDFRYIPHTSIEQVMLKHSSLYLQAYEDLQSYEGILRVSKRPNFECTLPKEQNDSFLKEYLYVQSKNMKRRLAEMNKKPRSDIESPSTTSCSNSSLDVHPETGLFGSHKEFGTAKVNSDDSVNAGPSILSSTKKVSTGRGTPLHDDSIHCHQHL